MDEQTMQPKANEPKTPPKIEAAQFVPNPALDALYKQSLTLAREYGWNCPTRQEFEEQYKREMAGKIQQ